MIKKILIIKSCPPFIPDSLVGKEIEKWERHDNAWLVNKGCAEWVLEKKKTVYDLKDGGKTVAEDLQVPHS